MLIATRKWVERDLYFNWTTRRIRLTGPKKVRDGIQRKKAEAKGLGTMRKGCDFFFFLLTVLVLVQKNEHDSFGRKSCSERQGKPRSGVPPCLLADDSGGDLKTEAVRVLYGCFTGPETDN